MTQMMTTKYSLMATLRPALVSAGLVYGLDIALGQNTYDWKQTAYDVSAMAVATLSSQIIKDAIPSFGIGTYGRVVEQFNVYALQPVLSAIIYSYIYNMTIPEKYTFSTSSQRHSMNLYLVGGLTSIVANMVSDRMLGWLI